MENIAQKIKALNYSEEMMAILPKFLGTLAAKDLETGEDLVTVQEIVQTLKYLKEKGISLRPSQIKVLANGFSYIKKSVEAMEAIGELKMYVDDPNRMTSKENVERILFLRDKKVEYKSPEGKYSRLAYSKRAFESEYGVIDFAAEKAKKEQAKQAPKAQDSVATQKAEEPKKVAMHHEAPAPKEAPKHEPKSETKPVATPAKTKTDAILEELIKEIIAEDKEMQAKAAEKRVEPKKDNNQAPTRGEGKKEINPEPIKKPAEELDGTKVDIKIPILDEPKADKIVIADNKPAKNPNPNNDGKTKAEEPKKPQESEAKKPAEHREDNKPRDIKPVTPVKPQQMSGDAKAPKNENNNKAKEERVPAAITKRETMEYTSELDLASLEASFNDTKPTQEVDEVVKNTVVNMTEGPISVFNTPYDEILSKPQTIALTDETFERYENLSDSIRRVLTTVYNVTELTDNITDNLIKLVTSGVASDSEVMYYAITYGKNISEEEAQHLRSSIEDELEYIKIFDLDTEGQGRAA